MISQEFLKGSRGYYHIKCLRPGCKHYIPAWDISVLSRGELDPETGEIIPENIRLICPDCGHRHVESDKPQMIRRGKYIHQRRDRLKLKKYSFQVGSLASQFPDLCWFNILQEQRESGADAPIEKQINFANSFKGLWFTRKKITPEELKKLKTHCMAKPEKSDILAAMVSIDTQKGHFKYITRAILKGGRSFLLDAGTKPDLLEMKSYYKIKLFYPESHTVKRKDGTEKEITVGIPIITGIWDEGGHIGRIIQRHVEKLPGMHLYKGTSLRGGKLYEQSKTNNKRLVGDKKSWNANLLHYLHAHENSEGFGIPWKVSDKYLEELNACQPPNGNFDIDLERWEFGERRHDFFDCEKMWFLLRHWMQENFTEEQWLLAHAASADQLKAVRQKAKPRRQAKRPLG